MKRKDGQKLSNFDDGADLSVFENGLDSLTDNAGYTAAAAAIKSLWDSFMAEADKLESVLKSNRGNVIIGILKELAPKGVGAALSGYVDAMTAKMNAYIDDLDDADEVLY